MLKLPKIASIKNRLIPNCEYTNQYTRQNSNIKQIITKNCIEYKINAMIKNDIRKAK